MLEQLTDRRPETDDCGVPIPSMLVHQAAIGGEYDRIPRSKSRRGKSVSTVTPSDAKTPQFARPTTNCASRASLQWHVNGLAVERALGQSSSPSSGT